MGEKPAMTPKTGHVKVLLPHLDNVGEYRIQNLDSLP